MSWQLHIHNSKQKKNNFTSCIMQQRTIEWFGTSKNHLVPTSVTLAGTPFTRSEYNNSKNVKLSWHMITEFHPSVQENQLQTEEQSMSSFQSHTIWKQDRLHYPAKGPQNITTPQTAQIQILPPVPAGLVVLDN